MPSTHHTRLDSWKQIADYLGRDVTTVIRWEKEKALPVHRVPGGKRHAVFAYPEEIDAWMLSAGVRDSGSGIRGQGFGRQAKGAGARDWGLGRKSEGLGTRGSGYGRKAETRMPNPGTRTPKPEGPFDKLRAVSEVEPRVCATRWD